LNRQPQTNGRGLPAAQTSQGRQWSPFNSLPCLIFPATSQGKAESTQPGKKNKGKSGTGIGTIIKKKRGKIMESEQKHDIKHNKQ